jgi:hypothetical protein
MTDSELLLNVDGKISLSIEQSESNYLYHYTSNIGLMGIIEKNCLWVSRADFLNDSLEIAYLKEILHFIINEIENSFEGIVDKRDSTGSILKYIIAQLKSALKRYPNLYLQYAKQTFILSLSENNDSLTLFSNYSNGDGYNIGFNREDLSIESGDIVQAGKVRYNREDQENIIYNDIVDNYEFLIARLSNRSKPPEDSEISIEIRKYLNLINYKLLNYSMFFKHPTFYQEEEFRIVFMIDEQDEHRRINFRAFNSIIIPYIEIKLKSRFPIEFITIGPKNNLDIAQKGVELFLSYNGYKIAPPPEVSILKSEIPLRY